MLIVMSALMKWPTRLLYNEVHLLTSPPYKELSVQASDGCLMPCLKLSEMFLEINPSAFSCALVA